MKTVTLSGWGQPHDALQEIFPAATPIDYAHAASASEALRLIALQAEDAKRVIGWSLGGQLAVRAIAEKLIAPKQLVLIATPYQFVDGTAMGKETFARFYRNYQINPKRTLHKAWELLHYEDGRSDYIRDQLAAFNQDEVLAKDWLRWLGILEHYSCEPLDFSDFPPTLLIHGAKDKVVDVNQSRLFAHRIKGARLEIFPNGGHAPHWHDLPRLRELIASHV